MARSTLPYALALAASLTLAGCAGYQPDWGGLAEGARRAHEQAQRDSEYYQRENHHQQQLQMQQEILRQQQFNNLRWRP